MKRILSILIITFPVIAQDITNKLGVSGNYDITDSSDNLLLRLQSNYSFLVKGTGAAAGTIPATGAGQRLMWYAPKAAFRVGYVSGTQWDLSNIGNASTAFGYNTIASGENSTAIGYESIASSNYSVAIGGYTNADGTTSIAIGNTVTANGNFSTAMGNYVSTGNHPGSFIIGDNSGSDTDITSSDNDNQMTMIFIGGYKFFTNDAASTGAVLASGANSWSSISDSTKKENFQQADGEYFLDSIKKLKLGSWNYKAQDSSIRHYGPMAQEIYKYFGKDEFGTIGNNTTLATADMDGIMMIAIQAIENRTKSLQDENQELKIEKDEEIQELKNEIEGLKSIINEILMFREE